MANGRAPRQKAPPEPVRSDRKQTQPEPVVASPGSELPLDKLVREPELAAGPNATATAAAFQRAQRTLGNDAVQKLVAPPQQNGRSEPVAAPVPAPFSAHIEFDPAWPWQISVVGTYTPDQLVAELYGVNAMGKLQAAEPDWFHPLPGFVFEPDRLQPVYRARYDAAMAQREAKLNDELQADFEQMKTWLDYPFPRMVEDKLAGIVRRWAYERFPNRFRAGILPYSVYLDRLFLKLVGAMKHTGIISDTVESYYAILMNDFDSDDEIRDLRDKYSYAFRGDEPLKPPKFFGTGQNDFFGILWEDVKSGAVRDRIGNYFLGLAEAGKGLLEGAYTLVFHPDEVITALGNLPHNLKIAWENRGALWNSFVNAPPNEQARMIGRLFGEFEILIATAGGGGGTSAAGTAPELARGVQVATRGSATAAALSGGGGLTLDLTRYGPEAARLSSLMAITSEAATKGQKVADELQEGGEPARGGGRAEPRSRVEPYERELEEIPEAEEAIRARQELAEDFRKRYLPKGSKVKTQQIPRTEPGRAQALAVTPEKSRVAMDVELDLTLPEDNTITHGMRFRPDGVQFVGKDRYLFLEHKEVLTIWERSHFSRTNAIPEIGAMLDRHADIFLKLKEYGCSGFQYSTNSEELSNLIAELIMRMSRARREGLIPPPLKGG